MSKGAQEIHNLIKKELAPHYHRLARCHSTTELLAQPLYQSLEPVIRRVLQTPEAGDFSCSLAPARDRYRLLAWNLERGIELDGQILAFQSHEYLKTCDVLLLTETDVGMVRSGNRAVAEEVARELRMYFAFVPCYLNLAKGSGVEHDVQGQNELGLHGNAVLSRYPI
ncbi:MAG: hypothetical protein ACE5JI_04255, partial [Acidobacteriota bacterium]